MQKSLSILVLMMSFFFIGISITTAQSNRIFEETNGMVAVEAEHFARMKKTDKRKWHISNSQTVDQENRGNFSANASNNAYIEILPDTRRTHSDLLMHGENFSNTPGAMAIVEYQVYFNKPGKYYVWARVYSNGPEDNGLHVGINGTWPSTGQRMQWCDGKNTWRWESKQRTEEVHCGVPGLIYLDVPSAGIHTIAFSMREDGFRLDKWIMTQDPDYAPADSGPNEKLFTGTADIKPVNGSYHFSALTDFENISSGEVPYYIDQARKALAINAAIESQRGKFATASTTFYGETNVYDVTITTLAEFDGECTYRFLVNGVVVGSFKNTSVSEHDDYKPIQAVFRSVRLSANTVISIEANSDTNGLIPEGDGTAWARGRWTSLTLTPSSEKNTVVRDFPGRIAWSADGNQHDTDDWLATPWALAMFRAAGMNSKVVWVGYNNHMWDEKTRYNEIHKTNIEGTVAKWGGFNNTAFFNEFSESESSIQKLTEEINKSTAENPLWIVAAGPIQNIAIAIEKADQAKLRFVTMLSHSDWNTNHAAKEHNSQYSLENVRKSGVGYKRIQDQNNQNGMPAWTTHGLKRKTEYLEFLKDHKDERMQWLWTCRVLPEYEIPDYQKGYYDFSDSGMAYWLITGANAGGDEYATPQKTYELLEEFIYK